MHAALRTLPLALGTMFAITMVRAQPAELPAIFAPRVEKPAPPGAPQRTVAVSGLSERLRGLITERVLVEVKAFELPIAAAGSEAVGSTLTSDGALMMQRFLVRSIAPRREEVEPPARPTWQFARVDRIDRRVTGYSATLFRLLDGRGLFKVNVLNGAGQGIDHGRDFTRVELEFSFKF